MRMLVQPWWILVAMVAYAACDDATDDFILATLNWNTIHFKGKVDIVEFHLDRENRFEDGALPPDLPAEVLRGCWPEISHNINLTPAIHERLRQTDHGRRWWPIALDHNCSALWVPKNQFLRNAVVAPNRNGKLFVNAGETILDGINGCWSGQVSSPEGMTLDFNGIQPKLPAAVASLFTWGGYFHETFEGFIPIAGARVYIEANESLRILLPIHGKTPAMLQQLELIGLNESRLMFMTSRDTVAVETLYIPTFVSCGWASAGLMLAMQQWIMDRNRDVYGPRRRIMVPPKWLKALLVVERSGHRGGCHRCLTNTDAIVSALRQVCRLLSVLRVAWLIG